ncbi:MAG TPA: hypothetical protein DEG17_26140 [Cyanobacteria bacterium UBA11149]|nr:hypothetical protein [Cyanobacteria bacterium UBA11367]HBE59321.1 hypothetical protein [Cyanobacteria bacterium UBA11366]HBK63543.1 hypothetical protein [Cyanobacteria bacterium UBA11166]HBR72389.1 hypothetical protein [Cyanobacteria bacterium UBA11159]HBS72399.1 hypothetical protein [Cyanobacteria bacterium UBA11153]HBW92250.1 hypothetical protein [Cyanobacteria bacterium UBA11149]HCA95138.1 hypothetical protein [Cyanobacteria bacterium UBA9226]
MEIIFGVAIVCYLFIAVSLSIKYFSLFSKEQNISPEDQTICIITFAIASIFWPIVIPISYFELFESPNSVKKTLVGVNE